MAFEKVATLDADNTISLGGKNKKTGKMNPTRIEGYLLGSKKVPDQKKKSGFEYIHVFQTPKGNVGVWGKTNMNNQIQNVPLGTMTRVTATGKTRPTKNGDMILFDVEIDTENTIQVSGQSNDLQEGYSNEDDANADVDAVGGYDSNEYGSDDPGADENGDEIEAPEAVTPPMNAKANADRQARVNALLKNKGK